MSSSPTGPTNNDDPALQAWAQQVGEHIPEGECWMLEKRDGMTFLKRGPAADAWKRRHPELAGYLSGLNEQIDDATGCASLLVALGAAIGLGYVGVEFVTNSKITYIVAFGLSFGIWSMWDDLRESAAYQRERDTLIEQLDEAGVTRNTLLSWIDDDEDLDTLRTHLRKDRRLASKRV